MDNFINCGKFNDVYSKGFVNKWIMRERKVLLKYNIKKVCALWCILV